MRVLGPSIRSRLILLVLVATLPLLAFAAVLLDHAYTVSAELIEHTALSNARRAATSVEAQIARAEAIGYALAELLPADLANPAAFEDAAAELLANTKLDATLEIIDRDGRVIADTLDRNRPTIERTERPRAARRVFETAQPQISGVYIGALSHRAEVSVHVPLVRNGSVRYDVVVAPSARSIGLTAGLHALPDQWFTIIVDAQGHVIADSGAEPSQPGDPMPPAIAALIAKSDEGFSSIEYRNGVRVLLGFTRADSAGWTVAAGVPDAIVRAPLVRSISTLAAVGAAVLLASLGLAWIIGRGIVDPLAALASRAAAGADAVPAKPQAWGGLTEVAAVAEALRRASETLQARDRERQATLQRAETSEARLLLAQEAGDIGTWSKEVSTGEQSWSPGEFKLYGIDPASHPPDQEHWLQIIHPEDRQSVEEAERQACQKPSSYRVLFRIQQQNGATRWLRAAGRSLFEQGRPVRLIGSTIDVTERQEAERSLVQSAIRLQGEVAERSRERDESERRFRTYFEYSSDALLIVRAEHDDFVYETINRAGERLFGLTQDQVVGHRPEELFVPQTAFAKESGYRQAIACGGERVIIQQTLTLPSGQMHLETIMVAVPDPGSEGAVRIISGSRDLTERQRIEARLAHAQRLEAVGQLTGGVAHDFNNLLTVVIGNLSLLRRRIANDERAARYLASVEAAAQRGAKLTASLLAFSRRQTLNVEQLDVGAHIAENAFLLRRALGEEIDFLLHVDPGIPSANADSSQLDAAMLNLVINARDAMLEAMATRAKRGGQLTVTVGETVLSAADLVGNEEARPGPFIAVAVADTGAGMPASVRARAFEPFFTTKEIGHGTGLGLSQVFGFVRQLGGHVTIDSTQGEGTTITIFLPATLASVTPSAEPPPEPDTLPRDATVLLVEDDASIREISAEMLRDVGLRVLTAANGPTALELLRGSDRVDLLFSDVVMPGGATGVDLARAAHDLRPALPVLLTSGYTGPALNRYGPMSDFAILPKPYSRASLLERIGALLAPAPAK